MRAAQGTLNCFHWLPLKDCHASAMGAWESLLPPMTQMAPANIRALWNSRGSYVADVAVTAYIRHWREKAVQRGERNQVCLCVSVYLSVREKGSECGYAREQSTHGSETWYNAEVGEGPSKCATAKDHEVCTPATLPSPLPTLPVRHSKATVAKHFQHANRSMECHAPVPFGRT